MLLGIDIGSTVLKVAAFSDRSGRVLAQASHRIVTHTDASGRREQDAVRLLAALRTLIRTVLKQTGRDPLTGIGIASQGGSMIVAERASGRPLAPMVLWNDARAIGFLPRVRKGRTAAFWKSFSLRDEPGMGLARLEWLRAEKPELIDEANIYAGAGDFVVFHLTGRWCQDACHAMQTGVYDAVHRRLTARPLRGTGVPLSFFPAMREGHEMHAVSAAAARAFGLPEGVPVAGPYMDHEAGWLGALATSDRPLQCSLGTAWVGNFLLPDDTPGASPMQFAIPSPAGNGRLVIQPLLTGNVTWDWALQTFVDADLSAALAASRRVFKASLLPPPGVAALPWLNWPNPLVAGAHGAACFTGLGPGVRKEDLLRAVAAAMCFELARVFDEVRRRGVVDSVVLAGGASRGAHFRALLCELFRPLPVLAVADEALLGTRGCLHGFGTKAHCARAVRIEPHARIDARSLKNHYDAYLAAFERVYSDVTSGSAFCFADDGHRNSAGRTGRRH